MTKVFLFGLALGGFLPVFTFEPGASAGSGHAISDISLPTHDEQVELHRKSLQTNAPTRINMAKLRMVLSDKFKKSKITSEVLEDLKKVQRGSSQKIDIALKRLDPEEGRLLYKDREVIDALGLDYRDVVYIESRYHKLHQDDGLYSPGTALDQEALRQIRRK